MFLFGMHGYEGSSNNFTETKCSCVVFSPRFLALGLPLGIKSWAKPGQELRAKKLGVQLQYD